MSDIVEFLTARLDEDERAARLVLSDYAGHEPEWSVPSTGVVVVGEDLHPLGDGPLAAHIARHDPARVLAEVAAKRRVMARHMTPSRPGDPYRVCHGCGYEYGDMHPRFDVDECPELRDLAAIYAAHPDYDPAWRVA